MNKFDRKAVVLKKAINRGVFESYWRRGVPAKKLAEMMNCTGSYVSKLAREFGLEARLNIRMRSSVGDPELLARMWTAGVITSEIAASLGYKDEKSVYSARKRLGLPARGKAYARITAAEFFAMEKN